MKREKQRAKRGKVGKKEIEKNKRGKTVGRKIKRIQEKDSGNPMKRNTERKTRK